MTGELDNTVKYLRQAEAKGETWILDTAKTKQWMDELHMLEKSRRKKLREEEKQKESAKTEAMFLKAKMLSFQVRCTQYTFLLSY